MRLGVLENLGRPAANVLQLRHLLRTPIEILKPLAGGPYVDIEHQNFLDIRGVLFNQQTVLDRVHAAEAGTVLAPGFPTFATRPDTLDKCDFPGDFVIGRPDDMPLGRAGGVENPLQFHVGQDVVIQTVTVAGNGRCIVNIEPGRHNDGPDIDINHLAGIVVIDGFAIAAFLTLVADKEIAVETVFAIDDIDVGNSLGKRSVDGFPRPHTDFELVGHHDRTVLDTLSAPGAQFFTDIARLAPDIGPKVSGRTAKLNQFRIRQDLNVGMPTGIQHTRTENSYGTVHGGESLIQLGHATAERR